MYESEKTAIEDLERTAFRKAEKKYKLYYDTNFKKKKVPKAVDLSQVIDFKAIFDKFEKTGELPAGVFALTQNSDFPIFCLQNRPGFYFISGALTVEEQCLRIKESLTDFPQPPNRTNHNAIYGPLSGLFNAAKDSKVLVEEASLDITDSELNSCPKNEDPHRWKFYDEENASLKSYSAKSVSASSLLRKLRWSTLGLQFDWSKRNYDVSLPYNKIPDALCQLAKKLATPAMPPEEEFRPEAAIVNYFASGDTLGGHLDDMEADWSKPIVSMSLGCKAIFLIGGKSRQDEPLAMFLRSGDAVLMAGEARECFHGVPRIFTDSENAEICPLELQLTSEDDQSYLEYIRSSRININIRQVF